MEPQERRYGRAHGPEAFERKLKERLAAEQLVRGATDCVGRRGCCRCSLLAATARAHMAVEQAAAAANCGDDRPCSAHRLSAPDSELARSLLTACSRFLRMRSQHKTALSTQSLPP